MLSTTELLVEHIISGILSLLWILGLCLSIYEIDFNQITYLKEYWIIIGLVITALSYPIGIFIDTFADKILSKFGKNSKNVSEISTTKLLIKLKSDPNATSYFTYNRFKSRIARSSFINFLFIGIISPFFILRYQDHFEIESPWLLMIVLTVAFLLLAFGFYFVWREAQKSIKEKKEDLWEMVND
jgi:hypothetical protein